MVVTLSLTVMPAGPIRVRLPAALLMALETVIADAARPLFAPIISSVPAVTRSSSASVRDNCPVVSVPRAMATPAVLF